MKVRKSSSVASSSPSSVDATAVNGTHRKKSILKKSDPPARLKADPELENLLVSDAESANNTPLASRKQPLSIVELPPVNSQDLKSLTGPKLRISKMEMPEKNQHGGSSFILQPARKPILMNSVATSTKNNGSVASKEIQTSTISLLALANAAALAATNNQSSNNNSSDTKTEDDNVFKCPNDMCRHNKVSSAMTTTSKRKICLCGRTMVSSLLSTKADDDQLSS